MANRPTIAVIDTDSLRHNLAQVREKVSEGSLVISVVKANGYGHGDIEVASVLAKEGVNRFGVAMVEEGVRLRDGGIKGDIILLAGVFSGQVPLLFEYDLTPIIFDLNAACEIDAHASKLGVVKKVHVKIDTGMGRLGILPKEAEEFFKELKKLSSIKVEGTCSHFADMENDDKAYSRAQLDKFLKTVEGLSSKGLEPGLTHLSNSASIIDFPDSHLDMIRPGLMLYGAYPAKRFESLVDLKPVLTLKSAITYIKRVPKGASISYGRTFVTERESVIATIPAGYADGISRRLSGLGEAIVRGQRVPMAGTVCMDLTMIDVTDVKGAALGDEVVFIGKQDDERITAEEVAEKAGTISYEIFCNISARVPRQYL